MSVDLGMPVLVVDDSRATGRVMHKLLMLMGFRRVEAALDGESALRMLRAREYGLIISDWNMQPMTGQMFLESVRADPRLANIPFILVTAEPQRATILAARDAGANGCLVKPFTGEMLRHKIDAVLACVA
jgi:two-component system chemotaxis response regulator CheY